MKLSKHNPGVWALALLMMAQAPAVCAQNRKDDRKQQEQKQRVGEWLKQHAQMPLDQQKQALQQDPDFKHLNPNQQQELINRLQQWGQRPPEERERMAQRFEALERLSPQDRQQLRDANQQRQQLPSDRRREVNRAYQFLRELPAGEQDRRLNSPAFQQRFSGYERDIIRGLLKAPQIEPPLGSND